MILHFFPGELSHLIALKGLNILYLSGLLSLLIKEEKHKDFKERDIRKLSHKLGIAAGLDKNGDYIDCLAALGLDFIELGTVTPRPQKGNPKPRIFRNKKERSLTNRLGFNNKGVDYLIDRLRSKKSEIIIGSSIGKNFDTPNSNASEDYEFCIRKIYEYSDYLAVNISSPNTQDLRELSDKDYLDSLLKKIKETQISLSEEHGYKPIFVKISPDETKESLKDICNSILENNIDGIICSNTSIDHPNYNDQGGLSGAPLKNLATN